MTLDPNRLRAATRLVHGGVTRSQHGETAEALYLTSGYVYDSAEQAEATFTGSIDHYQYSRFANPTVTMLEQRLCLIEGQRPAARRRPALRR
jgi:O-succinylhomoserine sulfhydrylase